MKKYLMMLAAGLLTVSLEAVQPLWTAHRQTVSR